jgi:hypothetical protein
VLLLRMRATTTRRAAAAGKAKAKRQSDAKAQTRAVKTTQHIEWRGRRITVFGASLRIARPS